MLLQYLKFFINGGFLGVVAWACQLTIYNLIGSGTSISYSFAAALTYIPLVVINFMIQRTLIFQAKGLFWRFLLANLVIMTLVSVISPFCKLVVNYFLGVPWGGRLGFAVAALICSIPSFFLKRIWVFGFLPISNQNS
jgi:putative flippase GtrA